ncbi:Similar to kazna: Kazrin-A (Danio rerio) [Cotesia congregata]|uniref:Similar to kazna: Kazrin-A (Danio rerio) n=1 Tax=Cotesia congregata TaxID=51543 RepID=A0A8J2MUQ2_COTCN|nr:Similar to kazna: Kazrin-A (Danio rerio) [Cotesia congregata]
MSAVVDNAVKTTQPQGVFSRAFAKRAQPYEEVIKSLNRLSKEGEGLTNEDGASTHPTLALMRRILSDAQAKLRVMVEENAATGARLDGELERARGECANLRGELRTVRGALVLNNNHTNNGGTSNSSNASGNSTNSPSTSASTTATTTNNLSTPASQDSTESPGHNSQEETSKRLSANSSPVDKRSSASEKSVSPVDKGNGPIDKKYKKDSNSPIDRSKTSPSADRGSRTTSFFQRSGSERSSGEKLRITTNRDSIRSNKDSSIEHDKDSCSKDIIDGDVRPDEDNEPPAPAPSSRPTSPASSLASRFSGLHTGTSVELASTRRLRLENERLVAEVARLRRLLLSGAARGEVGGEDAAIEEEARFVALEMELQHSREIIQALKTDRKRLKAEKFDLLNQMKALYSTLEDKERELRDFIRNYEQRMRENEATLGRLQHGSGLPNEERERERERERWSLLRAARDEADRSESLVSFPRGSVNGTATPGACSNSGVGNCVPMLLPHLGSQPPLGMTDLCVGSVTSTGVSGTGQAGDRGSCSADSGVRGSSDRESGGATSVGGNLSDSTTDGTPTITVEGSGLDMDSISVISSIAPSHMYQSATTPKDCSPTLSPLNAFSRAMNTSSMSRSVEQLSSPMDSEPRRCKQSPPVVAPVAHVRSSATRGGPWGSISRVFARSRHRKTINSSVSGSAGNEGPEAFDPYRSWSPLTEEGYAEKLRLLREAATIPMERWRAPTVLAWLEVALGMPQYGPRCAENIKSGKVLLELNDAELEAGLGITHPLHRKKLRLAIEEHRHPSLVRYPCIAQLGHTWVSSEWLPDLGLAQYSESFATNMVDARMLDHVVKKELEKLLGVTRKFHQASIMHGINLLRMLKYDRQALAVRRHQSEQVDEDPLVWTNQRFIRWARNIDLAEYADNLKDSGVHGALVVLEPSFTGDTMATALGIPPAKHMIRRHLTAELEGLVLPASWRSSRGTTPEQGR